MKKLIFIAFFISGLCSALFAQTDKATVEGVVRDSDGKPLSFATMFIAELGTGVSTDLEGKFRFTGTKGTEYTLNVSYLNHVDKEVKVKAGSPEPLVIVLEEQSYELAEVVVMADYKKNQGSTAVINQQALEHIQPTSVADVLSLVPGGLFRESSATGFNRISLRQSGSDDNTSLGMAVVMDGIPQDNRRLSGFYPGVVYRRIQRPARHEQGHRSENAFDRPYPQNRDRQGHFLGQTGKPLVGRHSDDLEDRHYSRTASHEGRSAYQADLSGQGVPHFAEDGLSAYRNRLYFGLRRPPRPYEQIQPPDGPGHL